MKTFKIYIPYGLNAVTEIYTKIIEDALIKNGENVSYIKDSKEISSRDYVVTIDTRSFLKASFRKPKGIINWYQGILPEELMLLNKHSIYNNLKYVFYRFAEKYALKKSVLNLFCSEAMRSHFEKVYGYKGSNYYIMPCFNETIQKDSFVQSKYSRPRFVYTGSTARWQCLPETLDLFKEIKSKLPNAELVLYCSDKETVQKMLLEKNVSAEIKFVSREQLSIELRGFKYGFLIRQDVAVNNVATPTKMSTYLGNGVIPVFSNVVGDFQNVIGELKYAIPLDVKNNGIEKIYALEDGYVDSKSVLEEYQNVFDSYYSSKCHMEKLCTMISRFVQ